MVQNSQLQTTSYVLLGVCIHTYAHMQYGYRYVYLFILHIYIYLSIYLCVVTPTYTRIFHVHTALGDSPLLYEGPISNISTRGKLGLRVASKQKIPASAYL